jgi:hypothetical protein
VLRTYKDLFFKGLTGLGVLFFFGAIIAILLVWTYVLPRPDSAGGFVYALNDHGAPVYVTRVQFLVHKYAILFPPIGFALIALGRLARGKNVFGRWKD